MCSYCTETDFDIEYVVIYHIFQMPGICTEWVMFREKKVTVTPKRIWKAEKGKVS